MRFVLCAFLLLQGLPTIAQFHPKLMTGLGTTGLNIGLEKQVSATFSLGTYLAYIDFRPHFRFSYLDQQILTRTQLEFLQAGAYFKWHPFGQETYFGYDNNNFYFLGGVFMNNKNQILRTSSTLTNAIEVGSFNLTQDQVGYVDLNLVTRKVQPFAGLGYQLEKPESKWVIALNTGIAYQGKPQTRMAASGILRLNARNEEQLTKNLQSLKYYPLFQVLIGYKID